MIGPTVVGLPVVGLTVVGLTVVDHRPSRRRPLPPTSRPGAGEPMTLPPDRIEDIYERLAQTGEVPVV